MQETVIAPKVVALTSGCGRFVLDRENLMRNRLVRRRSTRQTPRHRCEFNVAHGHRFTTARTARLLAGYRACLDGGGSDAVCRID